MGKEKNLYEVPSFEDAPRQLQLFLDWFNSKPSIDPVLKAAMAHLWFVNIHPFEDGNGRLTRTLTDMQLVRTDDSSLALAIILRDRKNCYDVLEYMGKHGLDITRWILRFLRTMESAIDTAVGKTQRVVRKALFWQERRYVALNKRQIMVINRLWDSFESNLNTGKWAKMAKASTATALFDIQDLVDKGILRRPEAGGRSTNYELIEGKNSIKN